MRANEKSQQGFDRVSERAKLGILCILLLIVLAGVAFTAVNTFQAVRNFQQQYSSARAGNVSAIRPWMTIHAISHIYHIPEDYLYGSLDLTRIDPLHRATLSEIASRKQQPVNKLINTIQHAILTYRKEHPGPLTPTPPPRSRKKHLTPLPRGAMY